MQSNGKQFLLYFNRPKRAIKSERAAVSDVCNMRITSAQFHCALRTDILKLQTNLGKQPLPPTCYHSWLINCEVIQHEIKKYDQLMGYLYQCPFCLEPYLTSRDCHFYPYTCSYPQEMLNGSEQTVSDEDEVTFLGVFTTDSGQKSVEKDIRMKEQNKARNLRARKHHWDSKYLAAMESKHSGEDTEKAHHELRNLGSHKQSSDLQRSYNRIFHRTAYKVEHGPQLTPTQIRELALSPSIHPLSAIELKQFWAQEQERFAKHWMGFTYKVRGIEYTVGAAKLSDITEKHCPAWESLLNADRPGFITMHTLVRDAAARLPNGEGSRLQVMELVRQSQYVEPIVHEKTFAKAVKLCLWDFNCEQEEPLVKWDERKCRWVYHKLL